MANDTEVRAPIQPLSLFDGSYCHSLFYRVVVPLVEFDVDGFRSAVGQTELDDKPHRVTCSSANDSSDFHVHLSWRFTKKAEIRIEFASGAKEPDPGEHEPFAEQFLAWIGPLFTNKTPKAEVHADFEYPKECGHAKMLLPLKASLPNDLQLEIDGFAFLLPSKPEGITRLWLIRESDRTVFHVTADRLVDFANFDPKTDIAALSVVLRQFMEEKET